MNNEKQNYEIEKLMQKIMKDKLNEIKYNVKSCTIKLSKKATTIKLNKINNKRSYID